MEWNRIVGIFFATVPPLTFFAGYLLGRIIENKRMRRLIARVYDTGNYYPSERGERGSGPVPASDERSGGGETLKEIEEVVQKVMIEGEHFGTIPGSKKPSLFKPEAEVLCNLFGVIPKYQAVMTVEDWTGDSHGGEAFFYYRVNSTDFAATT